MVFPGSSVVSIFRAGIIRNPLVEEESEEGCLSIPDIFGDVERPEGTVVRAIDRDGREIEITASGLLARSNDRLVPY